MHRVRFPAAPPKLQAREPEIGGITNQRWNQHSGRESGALWRASSSEPAKTAARTLMSCSASTVVSDRSASRRRPTLRSFATSSRWAGPLVPVLQDLWRRHRNRLERVALPDRRTILRRRQAREALLDPGDRVRQPDPDAGDVAERFVLLVVDLRALRAVVAGERAHIAGDHHAVAGADALLVARSALELTVGALADEQRDGWRTAGAHDQLVGAAHVERQALGSRVLGADQLLPGQTLVAAEDVDDRRGLHLVEDRHAGGGEI